MNKLPLLMVMALLSFSGCPSSELQVQRSRFMKTSSEFLFPLVNDLHRWPEWSAVEKLDPSQQRLYEGPSEGLGAVTMWTGDEKASKGRMEIVESTPYDKIVVRWDSERPIKATKTLTYTFSGLGPAGIEVTATLLIKQSWKGKFLTSAPLKADVEADLQKSLTTLKTLVESEKM